MIFNLKGRLANFDLPPSKPLNPLFEAIVNSIHSIEEKYPLDSSKGLIEITIIRLDDQTQCDPDEKLIPPVDGFIIRDNGIGFDEKNYSSFETSDTIYKLKLGGKGVGRFTWLKAFEKISIDSIFGLDTKYRRRFDFTDSTDGVENLKVVECEPSLDTYSQITLDGYYERYRSKCPKRVDVIASKIIEHCLSYFVLETCPIIIIKDDGVQIKLHDLYHTSIDASAQSETFEINKSTFTLKHIKVFSSEALPHRIHWCANHREVTQKSIKKISNLSKRLSDKDREFSYSAYISGGYLDSNVNPERTNFYGFGLDDDSLDVTWKELSDEVHKRIRSYLSGYLEPIREKKMERVHSYITHQAPEYRTLWVSHQDAIDDAISPEMSSESQIDIELYKIRQKIVIGNKHEAKKILDTEIGDIKDTSEYINHYEKVMSAVSDDGRDDLARYIVQRRVIIDLLEKSLQLQNNGEFAYEDVIHNMIMPQGTTTDALEYDGHNLWLIDEKLAYHYYMASDVPFKELTEIAIDSDDKADLVTFNIPSAFVEGEYPFGSITLVEFKRPDRRSFSQDDNPVGQLIRYIKKIRGGAAHDKHGQHLAISDNTPFYCYLICDITPPLAARLIDEDFQTTPDGYGYYRHHKAHNAYMEAIPYRKLVGDARKRNRALFEHLHL